ncbi:unnamed protein product [Musa acuminata subsp. burmannicoides]
MPATNDVLQLTAEEEQEACARPATVVRRRPSHGPQGGHRARPLTDHRQVWPSHPTELRGDCRPAAEREPGGCSRLGRSDSPLTRRQQDRRLRRRGRRRRSPLAEVPHGTHLQVSFGE